MACAQWLYHRVWCGGFPLFHLPTQEEAALEQRLSHTCFATQEFIELRMQIRLKLTESPPVTHARPPSSSSSCNEPFTAVLSLLERYVPYLLALERATSQSSDLPVQLPPPLFHGLDIVNLSLEVQSSPLPVNRWLAIEKALAWFTMAQARAMQAEYRTARGLQLQDDRALARAEQEWATSQRLACLAAVTVTDCVSGGAQAAEYTLSTNSEQVESDQPADRLVEALAAFAHALAHQCALRQIATHLSSLTLTVERSERLTRVASAFARQAFHLAREATTALKSHTFDTDLARQLGWCLEADAVRWKAMHLHCEQSVFHLDANPELALLFAEVLLTLKLPAVPAYSRRDAPFFTRIAQEQQLLHSSQLTQALDDKKELLRACQQRYGPTWMPLDLEKVKQLALDASLEFPTDDLAAKLPTWEVLVASIVSEDAFALVDTTKLESVITRNLQLARHRVNGLASEEESESSSTTRVSTLVVVGDEIGGAPRQEGIGNSGVASFGMNLTASSQFNARQLPTTAVLPGKRALEKPPPRPSSAQPSLTTTGTDSVDSRSWVTIQHAGKTLHFEKTLPRETAEDRVAARRNAVPMADVDGTPGVPYQGTQSGVGATVNRLDRLTVLKRPASSPSYLSPAKANGQSLSNHLATAATAPRMWTPTRFSCALCEQRFMRCNLPGVAVMKRVFDLRRKWGVVLHDAKKFAAPSALYARANVCLMCQEILQFDDDSSSAEATDGGNSISSDGGSIGSATGNRGDDVGHMIHNAIIRQRDQKQHSRQQSSGGGHSSGGGDKLQLVDAAQRKRARQSSTVCSMAARYAVQPDSERCSHTKEERQPWWEVDLANYVVVHSVKLYLRTETSHLYASSGPSSSSASSPTRRQRQPGFFPLHIALSMKSGVGRDLDDVLASCVSSQKFEDRDAATVGAGVMLVVWTPPPNARGRFVRVQSEQVALLHIERVHVYVAQVPLLLSLLADAGAKANRDARRRKLQRAAFRASVIAGGTNGASCGSGDGAAAGGAPGGQYERRTSQNGGVGSLLLSSLLDQPEQAEKKRLSKLYTRFLSLLEQRSRYDATAKDSKAEALSVRSTAIQSE